MAINALADKRIDFTKVPEAGTNALLKPGAYVAHVIRTENVPSKEYVKIILDICEGEFANRGQEIFNNTRQEWGFLIYYASYKDSAQGMFSHWLNSLERSNNNFFITSWQQAGYQESAFVNLKVGVVLGQEEYLNQQGEVKTAIRIAQIIDINEVRTGKMKTGKDIKIPELKKLDAQTTPQQLVAPGMSAYECPF